MGHMVNLTLTSRLEKGDHKVKSIFKIINYVNLDESLGYSLLFFQGKI